MPGYSYFAMCSEKSKQTCPISYWYSRVKKKILYRRKTCPYSTAVEPSSTDILYLNILYIVVGVGKYMDAAVNIGSNPVSKQQIQPECGE